VRFGVTEFTTIGAHREARGEVFQVYTISTNVDILEMEEAWFNGSV